LPQSNPLFLPSRCWKFGLSRLLEGKRERERKTEEEIAERKKIRE
jgi:hypothetical protein